MMSQKVHLKDPLRDFEDRSQLVQLRVTDTVQTAHCAVYVVVPLWRLRFQSGWALTYNYIFGHTGKTGPRNSGFTTAPWRGPKVQNSGESGLKGSGFQGGGKCGEIGHCNQAGRIAADPAYFRSMLPVVACLDAVQHPKSNPIPKAQVPCHGRPFPTLS